MFSGKHEARSSTPGSNVMTLESAIRDQKHRLQQNGGRVNGARFSALGLWNFGFQSLISVSKTQGSAPWAIFCIGWKRAGPEYEVSRQLVHVVWSAWVLLHMFLQWLEPRMANSLTASRGPAARSTASCFVRSECQFSAVFSLTSVNESLYLLSDHLGSRSPPVLPTLTSGRPPPISDQQIS